MRRIAIIIAAAAMLLTSFVAAADAREDRGNGRGRGDDRRVERRIERGGERGYGRGREPERRQPPPAYRDRGYEPPPYQDRVGGRRFDPRAAPPPYYGGQPSWRQGERLPPMYRGGNIRDPGRYRLRPAPPGYDWVGVGGDIYLVQRSTGMVLDTIPGGF